MATYNAKPSVIRYDRSASKDRNFDRSFILIGKACSGKSTLGNLILGRSIFKAHVTPEAFALTKKVEMGDCNIDSSEMYNYGEDTTQGNETLNIQVIDQPGISDDNFKQEKYCDFLKKCIAVSKAEMSASFLILVDLNSTLFSSEDFLTILNLAKILSDSSYSFFPNAIIVFTHADLLDEHLNQDNLEQVLREKIETEDFECIQELIDLVDGRYIFINGLNDAPGNRNNILEKIFQRTQPRLNVYINGNNTFRGKDLKQFLFGDKDLPDNLKKDVLRYEIDLQFNPDLNLFRKLEIKTLEKDIVNALEKLSGIAKGISAMVLLVSLEEVYNKEVNNLILNLPKTYNLGEEFKKDFWSYACIIFKAPVDSQEFVKRNLDKNQSLKMLSAKVNSRYTCITRSMSSEECFKRLADLVRMVKVDTEGKTYTDSVVLAEIKQTIDQANKLRKGRTKTQLSGGVKNEDLRREIPFFSLDSDSRVLVASNNFFWGKDTISPLIGYFILKNINPASAKKFRKKYPDNYPEIPTKEYTDYCLAAMKDCDD